MSTSFHCSKCKVSHAGECPPAAEAADKPYPEILGVDELAAVYADLDVKDLKIHYLATKKAMFDKFVNDGVGSVVALATPAAHVGGKLPKMRPGDSWVYHWRPMTAAEFDHAHSYLLNKYFAPPLKKAP